MIRVLYFARLREQLGSGEEAIDAEGIATIADLAMQLHARGGVWADAFDPASTIMAAVNQEVAQLDRSIADGDEVAFFPPVTGG